MRVNLVGSSKRGRGRVSKARVKSGASFLKYDDLKSTQQRILLILFLSFWAKITRGRLEGSHGSISCLHKNTGQSAGGKKTNNIKSWKKLQIWGGFLGVSAQSTPCDKADLSPLCGRSYHLHG